MNLNNLHFERKKPLDVLSTPSGLREQTKKVCSFFSSNLNNFSYPLIDFAKASSLRGQWNVKITHKIGFTGFIVLYCRGWRPRQPDCRQWYCLWQFIKKLHQKGTVPFWCNFFTYDNNYIFFLLKFYLQPCLVLLLMRF